MAYFTIQVQHEKEVFEDDNGPLLITCMNIASCISRFMFGAMSDLKCIDIIRLDQLWIFIGGIVVIIIPLSTTFVGLMAISVFIGIYDGITWLLIGPITLYLVGPRDAGQGLGVSLMFVSFGCLAASPIGGT